MTQSAINSISVIIPTYNRGNIIGRALDSVFNQSHSPCEIIVVDDGSTDNTAEIVKKLYPEVKYLYQSHTGVSKARNRGVKNTNCNWIAMLDSDDAWHKDKLDIQSMLLNDNPEYLIAHTDEIWIRNDVRVNQRKKHQKRGGHIFQYCLPLCVMSPSSVIMDKALFEDVGPFNETYPVCEDYDLWLRICAKYPVLFSEEKLVIKYGGHSDQLSKQYWGMDRYRIRSIENIISTGSLTEDDRRLAIQIMHEKIHIYINGARKRHNQDDITEFSCLLKKYPLN